MSSASIFSTVNEHCLQRISTITTSHDVIAAEDICDEHGQKLWAKGQPISAKLQEKLLARKLRAPLELCLEVQGGMTPQLVAQRAAELCESEPALHLLTGDQTTKVVTVLSQAPAERALKLLLTCSKEDGVTGLDHAIRVAMVATTMDLRARLSETDVSLVASAALAHDIGELFGVGFQAIRGRLSCVTLQGRPVEDKAPFPKGLFC